MAEKAEQGYIDVELTDEKIPETQEKITTIMKTIGRVLWVDHKCISEEQANEEARKALQEFTKDNPRAARPEIRTKMRELLINDCIIGANHYSRSGLFIPALDTLYKDACKIIDNPSETVPGVKREGLLAHLGLSLDKVPDKNEVFSMRMNADLRKRATAFAEKDGRDLKSLIEVALEKHMRENKPMLSD